MILSSEGSFQSDTISGRAHAGEVSEVCSEAKTYTPTIALYNLGDMKEELREIEVVARSIPHTLPQSYAVEDHALAVRDGHQSALEEVQERVLDVAAHVSGCPREELAILGLKNISAFKGKVGFRIIDERAVLEGRNNEVELVSVLVLRSKRDRHNFVPIIVPHRHPHGWGEEIRRLIDKETEEEQGLPPRELLKSRTRAWMEKTFEYLRESKMRMAVAIAAASVLCGVGMVASVTTVQRFQEDQVRLGAQLKREDGALEDASMWLEKARNADSLDEKLQAINGMFDDGTLGNSRVTEALVRKLEKGNPRERRETLEVIREILRIDLWRIDGRPPLPPIRGSSNGRALYEALEDAKGREKEPALRNRMTTVFEELRQLKEAPAAKVGG